MKLTDLFKFKLFERKDTADLAVVNENFQAAESEIDKRLLKTAVQNTNTVTEAGYALDARQANPNVKGSLGDQIHQLSENDQKKFATRGSFTGNIDDLINSTDAGIYWINYTEVTGTQPALSESAYYNLAVFCATNQSSVVQVAYVFSSCKMYMRMYMNRQWYPWTGCYTQAESDAKFGEPLSYVNTQMNCAALIKVEAHGALATASLYTLTSYKKNFGSSEINFNQYGAITVKKEGWYMLSMMLTVDKNFTTTNTIATVHRYDAGDSNDTLIAEDYFYQANNVHNVNINILIPIKANGYIKIYALGRIAGGYITLRRIN